MLNKGCYYNVCSFKEKRGVCMRKLSVIVLIMIAVIQVTGCSSKKAYESENTNESVQVDNTKEADKVMQIDEKSALQLVSERLDTTKYSVEKEDEITVDNNNYYVFKIIQDGNPLSMGVAVNKVSGELSAYKEDKSLAPYSEFTLYDENNDTKLSWEGKFQSDVATLELEPADDNSFEFKLTPNGNGAVIQGAAQINGKEASYEDESGYKITFENDGKSIVVNESGKSGQEIAFQGSYTK